MLDSVFYSNKIPLMITIMGETDCKVLKFEFLTCTVLCYKYLIKQYLKTSRNFKQLQDYLNLSPWVDYVDSPQYCTHVTSKISAAASRAEIFYRVQSISINHEVAVCQVNLRCLRFVFAIKEFWHCSVTTNQNLKT